MSNKNIAVLFVAVLVVTVSTKLLIMYNTKKADFMPASDSESKQSPYGTLIQKAAEAEQKSAYSEAVKLYKKALAYDPGNQGILDAIGRLSIKLRSYKEAEDIYRGLTLKSPDHPGYKVSLAIALLYQERYKEAKLINDEAMKMRSGDPRVHLIHAALKARTHAVDELISALQRYPSQMAVLDYLEEGFFDPVRRHKKFVKYRNALIKEKNKNSGSDE